MEVLLDLIDKEAEVEEQRLLEQVLCQLNQDQVVLVQQVQLTQHQLQEQVVEAAELVLTLHAEDQEEQEIQVELVQITQGLVVQEQQILAAVAAVEQLTK